MKKILVICTNADEAGAPRHVEMVANGLADRFEFIFVFGEDGPVSERLRRKFNSVIIIKEMRTEISPIKDLIGLFRLICCVRAHNPDLIHCHSAKAGMLGRLAAFICGKPWIYTVHGWGWRGLSKIKSLTLIIVERLLKHVGHGIYIFVAKNVMKEASEFLAINESKGKVVYNGVARVPVTSRPESENIVS